MCGQLNALVALPPVKPAVVRGWMGATIDLKRKILAPDGNRNFVAQLFAEVSRQSYPNSVILRFNSRSYAINILDQPHLYSAVQYKQETLGCLNMCIYNAKIAP